MNNFKTELRDYQNRIQRTRITPVGFLYKELFETKYWMKTCWVKNCWVKQCWANKCWVNKCWVKTCWVNKNVGWKIDGWNNVGWKIFLVEILPCSTSVHAVSDRSPISSLLCAVEYATVLAMFSFAYTTVSWFTTLGAWSRIPRPQGDRGLGANVSLEQ